jgi:hypothetical protein
LGGKINLAKKKNDHAPKLTTIGFHHATKLHTKWGSDTKNLVLCLLQAATSLPQNLKAKLDKSVKKCHFFYKNNLSSAFLNCKGFMLRCLKGCNHPLEFSLLLLFFLVFVAVF